MTRPRRITGFVALASAALAACGPNVGKADAYEQLADGMMSSGAYVAAATVMNKSIKYDSNEPRRWLKLGRAQRAADQPALAAISFQHALDLDPANIEGLENMAILLVRAGRYDEARSYVDPLMALSADDVAGLLALGAIAMYRKQYAEANKYADRLIRIAPDSIGGYSLKAHVLEAQGRPHAAAETLARQSALNPTDVDLALQLMDLYRKAGDVEGVRATALNLTKLLPDDPRYAMESARALWARGDRPEARATLAKLQQRYRGNPEVIRAIASFWLDALPRADAIARVMDMAARLAGRSRAALADILIRQGEAPAVLRLLAPVAAGPPAPDTTDEQAIYAYALLAAGRAKDARAAALKVLRYDGSNDVALIVRARTSLATRDLQNALTDAQLAASNNRYNEEAALLVPAVYDAMGNRTLTEKAWGDAQSALPDSLAIHRGRIAWLREQGRKEDAMQIAAVFARGHRDEAEAWRLYRDACADAGDDCAKEAGGQLKALGAS